MSRPPKTSSTNDRSDYINRDGPLGQWDGSLVPHQDIKCGTRDPSPCPTGNPQGKNRPHFRYYLPYA